MAVTSSGEIKLIGDVNNEVNGNTTDTNVSLTTLSTDAGKDAPHGLTEFYSYSAAPNPFNAEVYLDPAQLPASGSVSQWSNSGTNAHVATLTGSVGSMTVTTLDSAKCAYSSLEASYSSAAYGWAMNTSGSTGQNTYSLYNTQQDWSYYGFYAAAAGHNNQLIYPHMIIIGETTGSSTSSYPNTFMSGIWRYGVSFAFYPYMQYYDSSSAHVTTQTTNNTTLMATPYPEWFGFGCTWDYNPSGTSNLKMYVNGALSYTYTTTGTQGATSNSLAFGATYYKPYNEGGMYFGDQLWFANTLKSGSEISTIHNYFKADYGL